VKELDAGHFHRLYGIKRTRMTYRKKDYADYTLMTLLCMGVIVVSYGTASVMTYLGITLCVMMNIAFLIRHGAAPGIPVLLRRPQDVLYMLVYKIQNMQPMFLAAIAVFALDNLLIALTPQWPHQTELMRTIALYLLFGHFIGVSIFRTVILFSHLRHTGTVRDVLVQSAFKSFITRRPNIPLHVLHAYFTGLLAHLVLIAPWYIVITHFQLSVLTTPVVLALNFVIHLRYMKGYNDWFYRDHWLGHNSEFEFLYLHGTHHDAIPSGLIGVSGNGHLEGFLRHTLGNPMAFYNPVLAFALYTLEVVMDIKNHQYIPGVFPELNRQFHEVAQHSTHHWGGLEPYSIAIRPEQSGSFVAQAKGFKFPPDEIMNSIALDERLTGFKWDNPVYRKFLKIFDSYQN
jgi:hypothetical protein